MYNKVYATGGAIGMEQKHLYKTSILKTIEWAKEQGIDCYAICYGHPIYGIVKKEHFYVNPEEIQDIEIGTYQTVIGTTPKGQKVMRIILNRKQIYTALPGRQLNCPKIHDKFETTLFNKTKTNVCPVGYCHNAEHPGYVSKGLMDCKGCVEKNCYYFERYGTHPMWMQKEEARKKGEKRKKWLNERSSELF